MYVQKGLRARTVRPGEFVWANSSVGGCAVGSYVHLPVQCKPARHQGFYFAGGEHLPSELETSRVRIYFHATSEIAVGLVEHLSVFLNRYEIPFRLKCLANPTS